MICPNCENNCNEGDLFCFRCGTSLQDCKPIRKGSHWVPVLILVLLSALGIGLFFSIPMTAVESETPWFRVVNGTLYFEPTQYTGDPELTVPEVVNGQTVIRIGQQAFENCTDLTTVILPDTVLSIEYAAFGGCAALRGIFIPEGVTQIDDHAFANCTALEAISIPSTAASIGDGTFDGCVKLNYIFYNGSYMTWKTLYPHKIQTKTQVYCSDGAHLQG